jgi:hypothetical protein
MLQLHQNGGNWSCVDWGEVALWAGGGAVAGMTVYYALPVLLASPDSFVDLASMGLDLYIGDARGFALDALSLAIPGVTGAGALSHVDEAYDALHLANDFDNVYDTAHYANSLDNVYDSAHFSRVAGDLNPPASFDQAKLDRIVANLQKEALPFLTGNWVKSDQNV